MAYNNPAFKTAEERIKERLERDGIFTYPLSVPINDQTRDAIAHAADVLRQAMENDDCRCEEAHPEAGPCDWCQMAESLQRLERTLQPEHRGLHPDREQSAPEAIFLRHWQKLQERIPHLNNGYGTLELLLSPTRQTRGPFDSIGYVPPVSQRDAEVAATIVQWLGTGCGRCFIEECERQIREAGEQRREMEQAHMRAMFRQQELLPMVENLANEVALHFHRPDGVKFNELKTRVMAAIDAGTSKLRGMLTAVVNSFQALVEESDGVAGLHRNGEVASWLTLCRGGRFEEWCGVFDDAAAMLAAGKGKSDAANELSANHPAVPGANQNGDPPGGVVEPETR